ncbi:hypothetical protein [Acrocarpospora catenulata]|uniref:hypothetical protein n=1 Tax=Acrocarpospora catenulata TaxID=2836182 RepID=UPI001BDA6A68|nr:hypothetical protein [Acrocarpospora catenulata]
MKRFLIVSALAVLPLMAALPATADRSVPGNPDGRITTGKDVVSPTVTGDIAYVVEGWDLPANARLTVSSSGLATACSGGSTLRARKVRTDDNGHFVLPARASSCVSGKYLIEATEARAPFRTHYTTLAVGTPKRSGAGTSFTTAPGTTVLTSDGVMAFILDGVDFAPNAKIILDSAGLTKGCDGGTNLRDTVVTADRNGRFSLAVTGKGCASGAYKIEATEQGTPSRTHTTSITLAESE